jgi:plasmid stability protein
MFRCMRTAQLHDVSSTRVNVVNMSKMIQVRNVPDEMHRMLKMRAAAEGISLSDLIKRELGLTSGLLTFEELDARVRARGPSKVKTESTVRYIREARGD